jgi:hypothetical protein
MISNLKFTQDYKFEVEVSRSVMVLPTDKAVGNSRLERP